jgi:hypothetical protein
MLQRPGLQSLILEGHAFDLHSFMLWDGFAGKVPLKQCIEAMSSL